MRQMQFEMITSGNKEEEKYFVKVLRDAGVDVINCMKSNGRTVWLVLLDERKIDKKLKRGAGARSKTKDLPIQTVIDMIPVRGKEQRQAAFKELGISERTYQRIKRRICKEYGSLENAIKKGKIYFV